MYQQKGRNRFQPDVPLRNVKEIIRNGRAIPFPWDAIPEPVRSWLQAMAGAVNTQPEFLFLASERQMFCRFHDGNSKVIRTSHGRSSTSKKGGQDEKVCLAVGGFCQPQPYLNLHQMLGVLDDGFLDRISTCIIDSVILKETEIQQWNDVLDSYNIAEFNGESKKIQQSSL